MAVPEASWMPFWMPFRVAFWRLFRTAFWVPFWVPSPEGSFLEANRTPGACSAHRMPLKTHSVPQEPVFCTEYLFRTVEACFLHRLLPMMHRVPQEAFLSTARIFGTIKACFWYRVLSHRGRLPPQRSLAYILVDLFFMWGIFNKFAQINRGLAMQDSTRREFHLHETLFGN